jgi:hypothetical protein
MDSSAQMDGALKAERMTTSLMMISTTATMSRPAMRPTHSLTRPTRWT